MEYIGEIHDNKNRAGEPLQDPRKIKLGEEKNFPRNMQVSGSHNHKYTLRI